MKKIKNRKKQFQGFTLIELLTVVAIIGILAGILIPTVGAARKAVDKARTKATFAGWMTALEQYKAEYGYYPPGLFSDGGVYSMSGNSDELYKALTGKQFSGRALTGDDVRLNRKGISFYSFSDTEFPEDGADTIVDSFQNEEIYIVIDDDGDGLIDSGQLSKAEPSQQDDVRGKIVVYSADTDNNPDFEYVYSWD